MHPTIADDLARIRIADFHADAAADRRPRCSSRRGYAGRSPSRRLAMGDGNDPTGLVSRLLGRLRPAVAP